MHELSLAMSMIELAEKEMKLSGSSSIISVNMLIGKLSGVEPESLEFMIGLAKKNTVLDQSVINFELVDGRGRCRSCYHDFLIETSLPVCPECHGIAVDITAGNELRIVSMEVQ